MSPARRLALELFVASTAVVGTALLSQYVGGLVPCELCLYQRWPWYATAALMLVVLLAGGGRAAAPVAGLAGLILLAGAGLAFYHVGVEQRWFAGPTACSGAGAADSVEALKAQIMGTAPVRCDEVAWSLFGISMAGWNFIASLLVAAWAFFGAARLRRSARA
ncbi:MAG: disulfide bond formation protein B [Rhodospirillales bacterium]|nr:disulfide bond formation protein B [Rhodospirillales bacterium]